MINIIGCVVTVLSLVGTVLNIQKIRYCFHIWLFTNIAWTIIDIQAGLWSQAILQAIYTGLAVWGIFKWKDAQDDKKAGQGNSIQEMTKQWHETNDKINVAREQALNPPKPKGDPNASLGTYRTDNPEKSFYLIADKNDKRSMLILDHGAVMYLEPDEHLEAMPGKGFVCFDIDVDCNPECKYYDGCKHKRPQVVPISGKS